MAVPSEWNHNIHVAKVLLEELPARVGSALDVGCGQGYLLPVLAARADEVVGLDPHGPSLAEAARRTVALPNVRLVEGDVLVADLHQTFDVVLAVAVLHHLPLADGLARLGALASPGGTVGVVGLARSRRLVDWAHDAVGAVETRWRRRAHGGYAPVTAPIRDPDETYAEVEATAARILPDARFRRHALFRYTLVWTRPG